MQKADFRSRLRAFCRSETGSAAIALALFAIALTATATMVVLGATGLAEVPRLVYLVFAVLTALAAWDLLRERRKAPRAGKP